MTQASSRASDRRSADGNCRSFRPLNISSRDANPLRGGHDGPPSKPALSRSTSSSSAAAVNGCGIARDAQGRGFSVMLAEMGDLASGTSSAATKLVHGGLRYLEYYEFPPGARGAGRARGAVDGSPAHHLAAALRAALSQRPQAALHPQDRPVHLRLSRGRKLLPPTRTLDLTKDATGAPLKPEFRLGFEYSDCWVNGRAAGGAVRPRRGRPRRADPGADQGGFGPARRRAVARRDRGRRDRRAGRRQGPGSSSTPPGPGSTMCWSRRWGRTGRTTCGWSKAAISSCASTTRMTAATSSRTPTTASSSPSPTRAISP